jgi:hypothetical protein
MLSFPTIFITHPLLLLDLRSWLIERPVEEREREKERERERERGRKKKRRKTRTTGTNHPMTSSFNVMRRRRDLFGQFNFLAERRQAKQ